MQGPVFGKNVLLQRLATGGMAELYLARHRDPAIGVDRIAVVKLIASRYASDESFCRMFRDEVQIAARLSHPNIGRVLDAGSADGRLFMAIEYIHGKDLRSVMREQLRAGKRPLTPALVTLVADEICAALEYAHQLRDADGTPLDIVHRDVSPSNVMLSFEGEVKLIDFGIARAANRVALTRPGEIKGKLRYLSPEQVAGTGGDHRSDLFTLGVTAWEAAVGRHLFAGQHDAEVFDAILGARIPRPSSLVPGFPSDLERVLLGALAAKPENRYQSAEAMRFDLEQLALQPTLSADRGQLAQLMRELYRDEYTAWISARKCGIKLLDHLLERTPLSSPGGLGSRPSPSEAAAHRAAPAGLHDPPNRDPPNRAAAATATPPEKDEPRRRTLLLGEPSADQPAPPRSAPGVEPADSTRPTLIDTAIDPGMLQRPTVIAAPEAESEPRRSPAPPADDERAPPEAGADDDGYGPPLDGDAPALPRPRTGDWSHRAVGATRPGTHPFFKGSPVAPHSAVATEGRSTSSTERPGRRRGPLLLVAAIAAVLVAGGTAAAVLVLRSPGPGAGARAEAADEPGAAVGAPGAEAHTVRITSAPRGAMVFGAVDGRELGRTPLELDPADVEGTKVLIHLEGYDGHTLDLRGGRHLHVRLRPTRNSR